MLRSFFFLVCCSSFEVGSLSTQQNKGRSYIPTISSSFPFAPRVASSRGNLRRGPFSRKHFSSAFVILVGGSQSETERECSGKKAFSIHTNREPLNGSSFGFPGKNEPTGTDLIYGVERALLCPLVVKRADRPLDL